ncbi:PWWP domain-containing protein 2B isoform X1 [Alosa sapidissima]|uniref:PWWP domain-containing protein 2B isoform X1 n=1 Tax=Alosa sapidissima TaxID=34773 RepID=UPI001C086CD8|nr:PWWP domain-containing protein 2B isoform X1 [Alosa sapidissima]
MALTEELRAGSRIPVTIEQILNDTLVVTLTYQERSYTGILLDSTKKSGLFCLPDITVNSNDRHPSRQEFENANQEPDCKLPFPLLQQAEDENGLPEQDVSDPSPVPLLAGQVSYPSYFEGAPFPQPLWVRHSYRQWIPQPPPRPIKHKKRRTREPGRLTASTIRLRPRQVLCEKCKNTVNGDEDINVTEDLSARKENSLQGRNVKESPMKGLKHNDEDTFGETKRKVDMPSYVSKRFRKDKTEVEKSPASDMVPRSPVIKISYSTPQGKGEVMKIPSRVHGSVKPFCPKQLLQNGLGIHGHNQVTVKTMHAMDPTLTGLTVSIPKLKFPRPPEPQGISSPKINLNSHCASEEQKYDSMYEAKLMTDDLKCRKGTGFEHSQLDNSGDKASLELWSESSYEEAGRGDLTLLINFHKRKTHSSSISVCSSDSLDESKSLNSDRTSPELCDLAPGDDVAVSSTSHGGSKTVPPLTVRLHTRSMSKFVTEEGHAVTVGDVVWGKIHGFPWWPARVLSISGICKETAKFETTWPEAKVSWFGSPTTSLLSVAKLSPFCEFFQMRFNRKKKGIYRRAIVEAAKATGHMSPEITSLISHCET